MSYTNHTENYELPQYVGTDKPAWLGDINPAFGTIDTQLKANADDIASTNADLILTDGKAENAQETADGATQRVGALETALNLSSFQTMSATDVPAFSPVSSQMLCAGTGFTLAQNSDGSIFKFYGDVIYQATDATISVAHADVPGLSGIKGYKTMRLTTTPTEPYFIKCAGYIDIHVNGNVTEAQPFGIAVGNDGYVYFDATTFQTAPEFPAGTVVRYTCYPCLYFNKSFGDQTE